MDELCRFNTNRKDQGDQGDPDDPDTRPPQPEEEPEGREQREVVAAIHAGRDPADRRRRADPQPGSGRRPAVHPAAAAPHQGCEDVNHTGTDDCAREQRRPSPGPAIIPLRSDGRERHSSDECGHDCGQDHEGQVSNT